MKGFGLMNMRFLMPTKVMMEEDCIRKNANLLLEYGQTALIVTGKNSAKISGAMQDITEVLSAIGMKYYIYDKVMANPTVSCVYEGAAIARENKVDFVIGIGGGSPMDAAKAIALLAVQEIPQENIFLNQFGKDALPLVMIPTTAGTGSEVTANSILSSDRLQTKKSISNPILFPRLALLDSKYTRKLPMTITVNTALDALSHAVEGMLSKRANDMSDYIAKKSIGLITYGLSYLSSDMTKEAAEIPAEIRNKLLYASMLAGIVIAQTGTTAVHSMGYSLTYFKNIDHGRANALLLPGFMKFTANSDPDTVKDILHEMKLESLDDLDLLFDRLLGEREPITKEELEHFTNTSLNAKSISNSKVIPDKAVIYKIFERGLKSV